MRVGRDSGRRLISPPGRMAVLITCTGIEIETLEPRNFSELVDFG